MSPDWVCGKETRGRGFASWERRGPPRPPLLSDDNGKLDPLPALKRFDSLDPRRIMEITFEVARLGESLSRSHQDTEKSSRPER